MNDTLMLIDGIGPFFRHYNKKRINWSKIPFASIETEEGLREEVLQTVPQDFAKFVHHAKRFGYNGITLDDVIHLVRCDTYPESLKRKIEAYRTLFGSLTEIAGAEGMGVFVTMDVMSFHESLRATIGNSHEKANAWLVDRFDELFRDFPRISGVIVRFGESDGLDVKGDFRSELWLKSPADAKTFLSCVLPVFEQHRRKLIFRTWSVGAHKIGDLSWNKKRFDQVFGGIDSTALIISLKYGESDFFRYLPANPLFFESEHQKIVEFQTRREYEGFGAYPSFIGWDTEQILAQLNSARNMVGMSVWCQTGGWGKRRQLTFLRNSSVWVELNTFVIAKLWQGVPCQDAVEQFVDEFLPGASGEVMIDFLRKSDVVIKELLYIRELAERRLYFRRLRLPPQLFVFWDRIMIDPMMKRVLACLVRDHDAALRQGREALGHLHEMIEMATANGLPTRGLKLQLATFEIIAAAREYFFGGDRDALVRLQHLKSAYKKRFKRNYAVILNPEESQMHRIPLRWVLPLMLRERSRYRLLDQILTIRVLGLLYPLAKRFRHRIGPKFAREQAMGLDTLLK